jgi:hypothetical protein
LSNKEIISNKNPKKIKKLVGKQYSDYIYNILTFPTRISFLLWISTPYNKILKPIITNAYNPSLTNLHIQFSLLSMITFMNMLKIKQISLLSKWITTIWELGKVARFLLVLLLISPSMILLRQMWNRSPYSPNAILPQLMQWLLNSPMLSSTTLFQKQHQTKKSTFREFSLTTSW